LLTRITITPIIDVALVLVIILLITAPMLSVADLDVDLPYARSQDQDKTGYVSITLAGDGQLAIDEQKLAGLDEIVPQLRDRLRATGKDQLMVVVRADAGLPHATVRRVLDAARAGGASRLGIATNQTEVSLP